MYVFIAYFVRNILYYKKFFPSELILRNCGSFFHVTIGVQAEIWNIYPPLGWWLPLYLSLGDSLMTIEIAFYYYICNFDHTLKICIQLYMHLHDSLFISARWKITYFDLLFIQTGHYIRFLSVFEPV